MTESIVEFVHTMSEPKKGLKKYFEKKRRLGFLANLTEPKAKPMALGCTALCAAHALYLVSLVLVLLFYMCPGK